MVRSTTSRAAELRIHIEPLRCCTRTGRFGTIAVEELAVEPARNGLVVADGAKPSPATVGSIGSLQHVGESRRVAYRRRTGIDRRHGRGRRHQVDVMIVKSGDQRTPTPVDPLGRRHRTTAPDGGDGPALDHDVDD